MAAVSKREYVWLALIGAALIAAVFVVHRHARSISGFIDRHSFWGFLLCSSAAGARRRQHGA